jgi:outer membrane lipoprotein-sorting protein
MKRTALKVFLLIVNLLVIFVLFSCHDTNAVKPEPDAILTNPVHITWIDKQEEMESYRADVDVFAMNSRTDTGAVQVDSYSMSIKKINGRTYTRIDAQENDQTERPRSIVSDGAEMVMFNPKTSDIDFRIGAASSIPRELDFFSNEAMLSKVNLSFIRSEARRLSFNLLENSSTGGLSLELPSHLFPQNNGERRISTKAVFDVSKELLNNVEVVTYLEDGTKRTATSYPIYQEYNNTYIKTGTVHIIEYSVPYRVSGIEGAKIYNSPDDYPTISKQEYEQLAKKGLAFPSGKMFFGDPADLGYTETIIEMYRNVEINTVQNSAFKVIGGF